MHVNTMYRDRVSVFVWCKVSKGVSGRLHIPDTLFTISYYRTMLLTWTVSLVPLHGCWPFQYRSMQGFHLNKQEFWNALHLRYGWSLRVIVFAGLLLPSTKQWFANMVAWLLFDTITCETSLLSFCQKSAQKLLLSHPYNPFVVR